MLSIGHNCLNTLDDILCKIWADDGYCFTDAAIPESPITYRTYMEQRCNQACGYCIGSMIILLKYFSLFNHIPAIDILKYNPKKVNNKN